MILLEVHFQVFDIHLEIELVIVHHLVCIQRSFIVDKYLFFRVFHVAGFGCS
jgi:hypothetical protein